MPFAAPPHLAGHQPGPAHHPEPGRGANRRPRLPELRLRIVAASLLPRQHRSKAHVDVSPVPATPRLVCHPAGHSNCCRSTHRRTRLPWLRIPIATARAHSSANTNQEEHHHVTLALASPVRAGRRSGHARSPNHCCRAHGCAMRLGLLLIYSLGPGTGSPMRSEQRGHHGPCPRCSRPASCLFRPPLGCKRTVRSVATS